MSYSTVFLLYVLAALASLAMLVMGIYTRSAPRSLNFTLLTLAIFILNVGFVFEITATSLESALIATQLQYLGAPFIAPFVMLFVCEFCGVKLKKPYIAMVMAIPAAACILVLTWPLNGIFYTNLEFSMISTVPQIVVTGSAFYYVNQVYSSILPLVADIVLIYHFFKRDKLFKMQALMIIAATILPLLSTVFHVVLGAVGLDFNPTPIFLGITCMILGYSILRLGLYRMVPTAREHIVENMGDGYIIIDTHDKFVDANLAAKRILPQLAAASTGTNMKEMETAAWLAEPAHNRKNEFSADDGEGVHRYYRLSETEVIHSRKVIGRCIMIFDITETKQLLNEVSLLAERDPLTGLFNRRTLYSKGEKKFKKISAAEGNACMLMIDIDYFKQINDEHGHIKGDEVLKSVAEALSSRIRTTDILARYGGEEFCAFLPDVSESAAIVIGQNLLKRIRAIEFSAADSSFSVTVSVGVAAYSKERHPTFESLIFEADQALYEAKNSGRNTISLYSVK